MKLTKTLYTALLLAFLIVPACSQSKEKKARKLLKQVAWMEGTWQRTNVHPGTTAFEQWKKTTDGYYAGMGWSMKGSDTTFAEKLQVKFDEGDLFYVADVKENAEPTYFKITEISDTGFVSQNPEHDFPKMISYELKEDVLTVIISDGGDKKMGFVFKKLD